MWMRRATPHNSYMSSNFDASDSVEEPLNLSGDAGAAGAGAPRAFNSDHGAPAPGQGASGASAYPDGFGQTPGAGANRQVPPYGAGQGPGLDPGAGSTTGYGPAAGSAPGYGPGRDYGSSYGPGPGTTPGYGTNYGSSHGPAPQAQSTPHRPGDYPRPPFGAAFFESLRASRWRRPQQRWIGGVCSAVAAQSGWDVALVRGIALVAVLILGAPVAVAYALAWAFIPEQIDGRIHAESLLLGRPDVAHLGQALLLMSLFTPNAGLSFTFGNNDSFSVGLGFSAFILMILISAVILISYRKPPRASSGGLPPYPAGSYGDHNYQSPQPTYGASPYNTYAPHTPYVPYGDPTAAPGNGEAGYPASTRDSAASASEDPAASSPTSTPPSEPTMIPAATYQGPSTSSPIADSAPEYQDPAAPAAPWTSSAYVPNSPDSYRSFAANPPTVPHPGQTYEGQTYEGQTYPGQTYEGQTYAGQAYPGQAYPGQAYPGRTYARQAYPEQTYSAGHQSLQSLQQSLTRGPGLPTFLGISGAILVVASISYLVFLTMPEIYLGLYPMRDTYYLHEDGFLAFHAATVFTVATGFILGGVTLMVRALKGKPGTWLTGLSAVLAFLWLPLFGILSSF